MANPPTESLYLGVALLIVIIITGIFSYIKESTAAKIAQEIETSCLYSARVTRECEDIDVPAEELGTMSHKMSLITIFGHKHFHEKISTASDFGSFLVQCSTLKDYIF